MQGFLTRLHDIHKEKMKEISGKKKILAMCEEVLEKERSSKYENISHGKYLRMEKDMLTLKQEITELEHYVMGLDHAREILVDEMTKVS